MYYALQQDDELEAISVLGVREGASHQPRSAGVYQEKSTDLFVILYFHLNF